MVQALVAQEMMKWLQHKQGSDSHEASTASTASSSPFAHFAGIPTQSNVCCSVHTGCCGSWIVDTGASDHMTFDLNFLTHTKQPSKPVFVTLPDGATKPVTHIGQVILTPNLTLQKVLHVPAFKFNLLSVSQLVTNNNMCVLFYPNTCVIQDLTTKRIVAVAPKHGGLYKLDSSAIG